MMTTIISLFLSVFLSLSLSLTHSPLLCSTNNGVTYGIVIVWQADRQMKQAASNGKAISFS
jgi:hypothetical protein